MEIIGKVIKVLPLESGTSKAGNAWQKATIIVEYGDGQYNKSVAVCNMKNADAFSQIAVGTQLKLQIEVTSNEYNGRWFTSCSCWKWEVLGQESAPAQPAAPQPAYDPYAAAGMQPRPQTQQPPQQYTDNDPLPF